MKFETIFLKKMVASPHIGNLSSLGIAFGGNIVLVNIFLQALRDPATHTDFIVRTVPLIAMIEFLNIHSTAMLFGLRTSTNRLARLFFAPLLVALFLFYAFAAYQWGGTLGDFTLPGYFIMSLASKYFGIKSVHHESLKSSIVFFMTLYLGAIFIAIVGTDVWRNLFPFPEEVYRVQQSTWTCTSNGQIDPYCAYTFPIWGLLYYTCAIVGETISLLWKYKKAPPVIIKV